MDIPTLIYFVAVIVSLTCDIVIISTYIVIICNHTWNNYSFIPYWKIKYDKLKSLQLAENMNINHANRDREIEKGYIYLLKQFVWPTVDMLCLDL